MEETEDQYSVITMSATETLPMWSLGVEASLHMTKRDEERLPDELMLENGKRVNIIVRGRRPLYHGCRGQGHEKELPPREGTKCGGQGGERGGGGARTTCNMVKIETVQIR